MTHDNEDDDPEDFYESGNVRDMQSTGIGSNSGMEPDEALDGLDFEDLMKEGRKLLLEDLIKLVKNGQASPQEKNTLRQMLKDNGMIAGDPHEGDEGGRRVKRELPTYDRPDYEP